MSLHALGDDELDGIREALGTLAGEGLDACEPPENPADLELLALRMIGPFADPGMPRAARALLPLALSDRGDALAAGVLACLERLAPAPLSTDAAKARSRLGRKGIVPPFDSELGALVAGECYAISLDGRAELLGALLHRPGSDEVQGALLVVEYMPCGGGVIVEGLLSGPEHPDALRSLLRRPSDEVSGEAIDKDELARRLLAALGHMVDHHVELQADVLAPLLVLERALGSGIRAWPQPSLGLRDGDDDEDEGDGAGGAYDQAEELIEAFEASLARSRRGFDHAALLSHAPFVAQAPYPARAPSPADAPLLVRTLLAWKLEEAVDDRLEHWTSRELEEFLLVWHPRNGDSRPEAVERLPDCLEAFLRFLAESDRLAGEQMDVLVSTLARLRKPFEDAALDRSRWGIVKTLVMQMHAEGVDPGVAGAADAWLEEFTARPWIERERVIGLAVDETTNDALPGIVDPAWEPRSAPSRDATAGLRKARRRTAKASRRRNRR